MQRLSPVVDLNQEALKAQSLHPEVLNPEAFQLQNLFPEAPVVSLPEVQAAPAHLNLPQEDINPEAIVHQRLCPEVPVQVHQIIIQAAALKEVYCQYLFLYPGAHTRIPALTWVAVI